MASDEPKGAIESADVAEAEAEAEVVSVELPAPPGWKKKVRSRSLTRFPLVRVPDLSALVEFFDLDVFSLSLAQISPRLVACVFVIRLLGFLSSFDVYPM